MTAQIKRLIRLFLSVPLAFVFVIVIRVIRPFLLVRVGAMRSDRIGHFALETDLMLLEQEIGVSLKPSRSVDLWYAPEPIANRVI